MEPTTTTPSASGKIITALIIGLLVGFAMGVFWQNRRTNAVATQNDQKSADTGMEGYGTSSPEATSALLEDAKGTGTSATATILNALTPPPSDFAISVDEQTAGNTVVVREVATPRPVWVAVRDVSTGGGIGNILGARRVPAGKNANVVVTLLRKTMENKHYYIVLHSDMGADSFNSKEDMLIPNTQAEFVALK